MAEPSKDTIYIDVDDEITAVIDKLQASTAKVVALVLPKRATMLQSVVNMKLLKRAAEGAKKNLVLVTTEPSLLPLAGAVGLFVARTTTSRPEIPPAPAGLPAEESVDEAVKLSDEEPLTAATAGNRPVGELAGASAVLPSKPGANDAIETVELDNEDLAAAGAAAAATPKPAPKKNKKLAVPNFDRFRLVLVLGVLGIIILVILFWLALAVLPKATIDIKTDASNINTSVDMTLDSSATSLDPVNGVVPAQVASEKKTYTGTAKATGQQNNGDKASGQITLTDCVASFVPPADIPAGTGVSTKGLTYITGDNASFTAEGPNPGHTCFEYQSNPVSITAQSGGSNYNVSNATFSVANDSSASGNGSASGGTDNIVTVVSAGDINSAKGNINADQNGAKQDLESQLQGQNLYPVVATFSDGSPKYSDSAQAGDPANSVTVTETVSYTMFGVAKSDLKTLVDNDIKGQIDTSKQSILSEGIDGGVFKVNSSNSKSAQVNLQTTAEVGPDLDIASIKRQAAGQKSGDIASAIKGDADVENVQVHLSPFWVGSAPKNLSKITVNIAKPTTTINNGQ